MEVEVDIEQRTEWLKEFQEAHRQTRWALGALNGQADMLSEAGLSDVANKLTPMLDFAWKAVEAMDAAVSRMISEDFQASMNQTNETFMALLGACNDATKGANRNDEQ